MVVDPTDPETFEDYSALQRSGYEDGDKAALLQMILVCAQDQKPLPDWAVTAFENAYHLVVTGGARSWDDVFGNPHPKGKHHVLRPIPGGKLNRAYMVHTLIRDIHEKKGEPINNDLFESVGRDTGFGGRTTIAELYSKAKYIWRRLREGH
jgi:hypothetical protein